MLPAGKLPLGRMTRTQTLDADAGRRLVQSARGPSRRRSIHRPSRRHHDPPLLLVLDAGLLWLLFQALCGEAGYADISYIYSFLAAQVESRPPLLLILDAGLLRLLLVALCGEAGCADIKLRLLILGSTGGI